MARKTLVAKTRSELNAEDFKTDERRDRAPSAPRPVSSGLLSLQELRELRGIMTEDDLIKRARDAARLELLAPKFGPDDRADVAAQISADVLAENYGCPPRADSPRATLTAFCDRAKTLRRSIDRQRARDTAEAQRMAEVHATSAEALGIDSTPARAASIVGRSSELLAARAASSVCAELGLPVDEDSPAWTLFYVWARGASPEVCAAERGVSHAAWRVRQSRGAKFVRGFYSGAELLAKLTLGARTDDVDTAEQTLVYVTADDSRKARDRTRMLADVSMRPEGAQLGGSIVMHWRERPAEDAEVTRRTDPSIKLHHMTVKARRGGAEARRQARADARRKLGAAYAATSHREKGAKRTSDLARDLKVSRAT